MLEEDLVLKKKISNYYDYILKFGISIKENDYVEIVTTSYLGQYLDLLIERIKVYNANIILTFIDGDDLESIINGDYNSYIDEKINMYHNLIEKGFKRLTIISPFFPPLTRTKNAIEYLKQNYKMLFVRNYFLKNPHSIFPIANIYWAHKMQTTIEELWNQIFDYCYKTSELEYFKDELDNLNLKALHFKTSLGTDLYVGIPKDSKFLGKKWNSFGIEYQPNIPCLEIFISPDKYKVDGILASSKPLFYSNQLIKEYKLVFKDGEVIENQGLDDILNLDPNLKYAGEIAIVLDFNPTLFYSTIMDENSGCHLALGNGYDEGVVDIKTINHSKYHIDLVFGTNDIDIDGIDNNDNVIPIVKNGKLLRN